MEKTLKRLEGEVEEVKEELEEKEGMTEQEFMELIIDEINHKTLNIVGSFNEDMVKYVRAFANNLWYYEGDENRPLYINISSRGGEADCLFAILDILDECVENWGCKLIANGNGYMYSCAGILFLYCQERHMGKMSEIMLHQILYGINGNLSDHTQELKRTQKLQKKIDKLITEHSPITQRQLRKWYKDEGDKFIDYEEAMKLGLLTVEEENK